MSITKSIKDYRKALICEMEFAAKGKGFKELNLRTCCYSDSYLIYYNLGFVDQRLDSRYLSPKIIMLGKGHISFR